MQIFLVESFVPVAKFVDVANVDQLSPPFEAIHYMFDECHILNEASHPQWTMYPLWKNLPSQSSLLYWNAFVRTLVED